MTQRQLPTTRTGPEQLTVVLVLALLVSAAVVVAVSPLDLTHRGANDTARTVATVGPAASTKGPAMVPAGRPVRVAPRPTALPDEGASGGGTGVFDDGSASVANLDPDLLSALRAAATAARDNGVEFHVNSGWRSAAYQEQLLQEAIAKYGSEKEAERWVATPETSAHVSGEAVDLGPSDAESWLSRDGAAYGLCQIYRNEPWHYELRPGAALNGCPAMYSDPTQDPRMRR